MDRAAAARAIDDFLLALGRKPAAEPELHGTGARVAEAFATELCSGYEVDVDALLRGNIVATAAEQVTNTTGIVELRDVALATTCPHHLMAGLGKATVAYAPRGAILGAGTLARLLEAFAKRLTLQETIGENATDALFRNLSPRWAACRIEMTHACMTARGERAHGARLVTFAVRGEDEAARSEAIVFVRGET
jgi:GTP cyclohydrolase IA